MNDLTTISNTALANRYFDLAEAARAAEHPGVCREYIRTIKEIQAELLNRLADKEPILLQIRQYLYTNLQILLFHCDACVSGKPYARFNCPEVRRAMGEAILENSRHLSKACIVPLDLMEAIGRELIITAEDIAF